MGLAFCGKCGAIVDGTCPKCTDALVGRVINVESNGVKTLAVIGSSVKFRGHDVHQVYYEAVPAVHESFVRCAATLRKHIEEDTAVVVSPKLPEDDDEEPRGKDTSQLPESTPCVAQRPRDSMGEGGERLQESVRQTSSVPALEGAA